MEGAGPSPDHFRWLIPGFVGLGYRHMIRFLTHTLTVYLDSPQAWKEFESADHGLCHFLCHLTANMRSAAETLIEKEDRPLIQLAQIVKQYFDVLSTASKLCHARLPHHVQSDR